LQNNIYRETIKLLKRLFCLKITSDHIKLNNWRTFIRDFKRFKKLSEATGSRFALDWRDIYPCLGDKAASTTFDPHYVYHPAWAARILARTQPEFHVDISSSLHFSTVVSAFIPVKFYDYRPVDLQLNQLSTDYADLTSLPFEDDSIQSISCMHVVEHVGLGRYGDTLDPDGDLRAMGELQRVLAEGGSMLFVVPVGRPRIMFNAHRIYSYQQILEYFGTIRLKEFALIPDSHGCSEIVYNASRQLADLQNYGCGCFWFKKEIS
jgi:SAM-dependent methyltransferase